jgi:hypothetical protein
MAKEGHLKNTPLMHNWFLNTKTIIDPSIQLIISLPLKW